MPSVMEKINKLLAEYQDKIDALEKAAERGAPEKMEEIREANDRGTIRLHTEMQTVLGVTTLEVLLGIQIAVQAQTKAAREARSSIRDLGTIIDGARAKVFPLLDQLAGCVTKDGSIRITR